MIRASLGESPLVNASGDPSFSSGVATAYILWYFEDTWKVQHVGVTADDAVFRGCRTRSAMLIVRTEPSALVMEDWMQHF